VPKHDPKLEPLHSSLVFDETTQPTQLRMQNNSFNTASYKNLVPLQQTEQKLRFPSLIPSLIHQTNEQRPDKISSVGVRTESSSINGVCDSPSSPWQFCHEKKMKPVALSNFRPNIPESPKQSQWVAKSMSPIKNNRPNVMIQKNSIMPPNNQLRASNSITVT
jgi:hypothetical protein